MEIARNSELFNRNHRNSGTLAKAMEEGHEKSIELGNIGNRSRNEMIHLKNQVIHTKFSIE